MTAAAAPLRAFPRPRARLPRARRGHPAVVQIKNVATFQTTGHLADIVTELAFGPSLCSRLTRPFSEDETRGSMR